MPVAARVREGAQEALRLGIDLARLAVLDLARRPGEPPCPTLEDLPRRVRLPVGDGAQQDPDAGQPVLLPRRRLGHHRDEVVELGALDRHGDAVGERHQAEPPIGVLGRGGEEELLERRLRRVALGQLLDELGAVLEADLPAGDDRPDLLLLVVEVARIDALPLALDHGDAAAHVGRDRDEPRSRSQLAAGAALHPAARGGGDARPLAVEVGVEQRVQRDDALVVRRALRDEVDDDSCFLARVRAHDAADPLLVDALRRGRRQVHDDRRARRVPAFCEQHGVDQDVDLAALVGGERLGELDRGRAARDGLRLDAGRAELLGEVVGVVDAGGVDDPGRVVETVAVQARGGLVQCLVVEGLGQDLLVEVAADDRHGVDGRDGRDAQVAERRDEAAARGVL